MLVACCIVAAPAATDANTALSGGRREEVDAPVVAAHELAGRVVEIDLALQHEACFAADEVGGDVVDGWKGVEEAEAVGTTQQVEEQEGGAGCDAETLKLRQDAPTSFPEGTTLLGAEPVANGTRGGMSRAHLDDVHRTLVGLAGGEIPGVTVVDLVGGFGAAYIAGHGRIAHEPLQERQVCVLPSAECDRYQRRSEAIGG